MLSQVRSSFSKSLPLTFLIATLTAALTASATAPAWAATPSSGPADRVDAPGRPDDGDSASGRAKIIPEGQPLIEAIGADGQPLNAPAGPAKKKTKKQLRAEKAAAAKAAASAPAAATPSPVATPIEAGSAAPPRPTSTPEHDGAAFPTTPIAPLTPTPSPTPTATPAPTAVPRTQVPVIPMPLGTPPPPTPPPRAAAPPAAIPSEALSGALKTNCEQHFPGQIQSEVRAACLSAAPDFGRLGRSLGETRCRLNYGEEPRLVMACLIGVSILSDELANRDDYRKKLALCNETYPVHNEIDAFLQESCLTGIHVPDLGIVEPGRANAAQDTARVCSQITPERSFLGPCAVGLSLTRPDSNRVPPAKQTAACEKYFNLSRYHQGYRACLNARAVASQMQIQPAGPVRYTQVLQACSEISSDVKNENERAACFVGLAMFRHLEQQKDVDTQFKKCGENKVTFQDRDFLACLTAASLLDFTDKNGADAGCREIFKGGKSSSRSDCVAALAQF